MDMEDTLLLFDEGTPCWRADMLEMADADAETLNALTTEGSLVREDGIFFLSPRGVSRFRQLADEYCLPLKPGIAVETGIKRDADRSFLQYLLDKRHVQRRGIKEYRKPFSFELPNIREEEKYSFDGKKIDWLYAKTAFFQDLLRSFPATGWEARAKPPIDPDRVAGWLSGYMPHRRIATADLLYKCHYDFQHYTSFPKISSDFYNFLNTDRYFFFFSPEPCCGNLRHFLTVLANLQIFITMMRRLYLPGYFDYDSLEQYSLTWVFFVYERENDVLRAQRLLDPYGQFLAGEAAPLEVWSLSVEALKNRQESVELINDLLPRTATPILRAV